MKNDDLESIPEINTIGLPSSPRDRQAINATSGERASSSNDSSGSSSPSDLRRRLQDLPSSDEFSPLGDRTAALGRRIIRKRELFLRLHGATDRIEESDEWEDREERAEGSLGAAPKRMPMDARARRRARIRFESSRRDDKAMAISRPADPFKVTDCDDDEEEEENGEDEDDDNNHDKLNPVGSAAARSTQECDYTRLPAIEPTLRHRPQPTSLSEPATARFPRRVNIEERDVRSAVSVALRDGHSRWANLHSVSPFSVSHLRSTRSIGGYRPTPGVILKNLSSGSESGSTKEASRGLPSARKIIDSPATLELSPPEFKPTLADEPTKKMPIMSARSDITASILPNLLPSVSQRKDDRCSHVHQDDSRRCTESEYSYDAEEEESYRARLITPKTHHDNVEDRRLGFDCSIRRSDNGFFKAPGGSFSENVEQDVLDTVERPTSVYAREADDDSSRLTGRIRNDTTEEALSSQTSEPFGSEDRSRSSCTPKMCWQKEALSSGRFQNDTDNLSVSDKYDRDITRQTITNVPMLALNSQDISCSTSTYSRECSAVQHLDPRELIEALSAASLQRREEEREDVRKHEDLQEKYTIDASCRISRSGETWRVPRSSTSESPGKTLSRVPSKIPVKVPSSKVVPSSSATKLPGYRAKAGSLSKIANYEEAGLNDRNVSPITRKLDSTIKVRGGIVHRQPDVDSYSRIRKQDPLPRSRENSQIQVRIGETRSNTPEDEETECEIDEPERVSSPSSNSLRAQSTEPETDIRPKAQRLSESRCNEKSRSFVFCPNEVASPGDWDFSRFDDDVQSRSRDSTSWKTEKETTNVMSFVESPCLSRCRNNVDAKHQSSQVARENVTWRTEDEWASNDEEYLDDIKDKDRRGSCDDKSEVACLRTKKCFGSTIEGAYDPSSCETLQPLRSNRPSEIGKIVKEQGVRDEPEVYNDEPSFDQSSQPSKVADDPVFQLHRTQGMSSFAARMSSSALNLSGEPTRKKRKSQERFPFTISEAPTALAAKRESTIDSQVVPDKDLRGGKTDDQLKERTTHQLKTHPSITRLANADLENNVADILYCVAQDQRKDELFSSRTRLKGFMRMFSSKFRRTSKQRSDARTAKPAEVLYENRACQVDSRANSCSGDSSAEGTHGSKREEASHRIAHRVARSNPTLVFEENALRKTSSLIAIPQNHPHRRHDRDDMWVRDLKDAFLEKKDNKTLQAQDQVDNSKDRYSIFLAKTLQSGKVSMSNVDRSDCPEIQRQRDPLISDHVASSARRSKRGVYVDTVPEIDEIEEVLSGCLCMRLCRLIAPSKPRLSLRVQVPSSKTKKPGSFLRKKKVI